MESPLLKSLRQPLWPIGKVVAIASVAAREAISIGSLYRDCSREGFLGGFVRIPSRFMQALPRVERLLYQARPLNLCNERDLEDRPTLDMGHTYQRVRALLIKELKNHQGPIAFKLLGPGRSKTDPLYADDLLSEVQRHNGNTGRLIVHDRDSYPLTPLYYKKIAFKSTEVEFDFGDPSGWDNIPEDPANVIMMAHPPCQIIDLRSMLIKQSKPGTIVIIQKDLHHEQNIASGGESAADRLLYDLKYLADHFDVMLHETQPAFRTFFSVVFEGNTHTLVLRRK